MCTGGKEEKKNSVQAQLIAPPPPFAEPPPRNRDDGFVTLLTHTHPACARAPLSRAHHHHPHFIRARPRIFSCSRRFVALRSPGFKDSGGVVDQREQPSSSFESLPAHAAAVCQVLVCFADLAGPSCAHFTEGPTFIPEVDPPISRRDRPADERRQSLSSPPLEPPIGARVIIEFGPDKTRLDVVPATRRRRLRPCSAQSHPPSPWPNVARRLLHVHVLVDILAKKCPITSPRTRGAQWAGVAPEGEPRALQSSPNRCISRSDTP
jgi:hypothetical protein